MIAGQLELAPVGDLEPIGPSCGRLLIDLLRKNDWRIIELGGFAGGTIFHCEHPRCPIPLDIYGESVAQAAAFTVEACNRYVAPPAVAA